MNLYPFLFEIYSNHLVLTIKEKKVDELHENNKNKYLILYSKSMWLDSL